MKRIIVELSNERLITPSGLTFVGAALGESDLVKRSNRMTVDNRRSQPQIKNEDILLTYIGLLCQGKTSFDSVREFHADPDYFKAALSISYEILSAETLRQRMDATVSSLRKEILLAKTIGVEPTALEKGHVPLDMVVTPFDNSKTFKEGVFRTFKGFDGYAPMMAYIGTEGFLADTELRKGKQHSQKETPASLKETISMAHQLTAKPLLIRMDSGNYAAENLGILIEDDSWFVIKRNLRASEKKEEWLEKVQACCKDVRTPREGKTVYVGSSWKDVPYKPSSGEDKTICLRNVYEVIERTID